MLTDRNVFWQYNMYSPDMCSPKQEKQQLLMWNNSTWNYFKTLDGLSCFYCLTQHMIKCSPRLFFTIQLRALNFLYDQNSAVTFLN